MESDFGGTPAVSLSFARRVVGGIILKIAVVTTDCTDEHG
jgi:hypothetical protein